MSSCEISVVTQTQRVVIDETPPQVIEIHDNSVIMVTAPSPGSISVIHEPNLIVIEGAGVQGPPGPPGPPGPGTSTPAAAAVNIAAFQLVALNGSGLAYLPSNAVPGDAARVLGFAATSALTGETFQVVTTGILDTPAVWTPGPQYLGTTPGTLVSVPPSAPDFELSVATAVTSSRLIVNVQFPIILT